MSVTTMTISVLASQAGVGVETVRYYQRTGLMAEPVKPSSGYRQYGNSDLNRLLFIRRAKRLGFSLKDIRALLALDTDANCQTTRDLAASRLQDVQVRMHDLQVMAKSLESMVASCDQNIAEGAGFCPAIDNIISDPSDDSAR